MLTASPAGGGVGGSAIDGGGGNDDVGGANAEDGGGGGTVMRGIAPGMGCRPAPGRAPGAEVRNDRTLAGAGSDAGAAAVRLPTGAIGEEGVFVRVQTGGGVVGAAGPAGAAGPSGGGAPDAAVHRLGLL
jgi:hypothetical protein